MMIPRWLVGSVAALILAGCGGTFETSYDAGIPANVTKNWRVTSVNVSVPDSLTVSNRNSLAPSADIVWHGEPFGDRRAQVARIVDDGLTAGTSGMSGERAVSISASIVQFHAVTPRAVSQAPGAVHNISYAIRVFDAATGQPLTEQQLISADFEAYVGAAAVTAAVNGQSQRVRITQHLADVTRGWLGRGPDMRRRFSSIGR